MKLNKIKMNESLTLPVPKGDLEFQIIDKRTGEIVDSFKDHNIVVKDSRRILIKRLYENLSQWEVARVKIGEDVGSGDMSDPEMPTEDTTAEDMMVLYDTEDGMDINYLDEYRTSYNIFIPGQDVLDQHPGNESIQFTSLGLYARNGVLFSYRRFPARTLTVNFNVNVIWTIYYDND